MIDTKEENVLLKEETVLKIEGMGNKHEEPVEFEKSYYRNEYLQAFKVVENIIRQTEQIKNKKVVLYENQEIYNIIPFIGGRGSGKTSAMLSFAGALSSYHEYRNKEMIYDFFAMDDNKHEEVQFTCLECIDGSLLEKGEDIFKVILAQLYGKFLKLDRHGQIKNKSYDYEKRELQQEFDKLYGNICKLESNEKGYYEESSITSLKNLSSSLELKNTFADLICRYLEILEYEKYETINNNRKPQRFLVIVIDDLDLNIGYGFEMMEKIHRYMMVPQVIVLLAVDHKQLKMLCEKHFFQMIPKSHKFQKERSVDAENLAQDFIDKVLPINVRIYMPLFKRRNKLEIEVYQKKVDVKQGIFWEIYRKAGMRLDYEGEKRHFYESESLRGFVNLYLLLDGMRPLFDERKKKIVEKSEQEKKEFWSEYEKNYSILLSDIITRMADEKLDTASKQIFVSLTDANLVRSCRKAVFYIEKLAADDSKPENRSLKDLAKDIEQYDYSYGELLHTIYLWGRVNDECKQLIRCLLAFFSLEMTHTYYIYQSAEDNKAKKMEEEKNKVDKTKESEGMENKNNKEKEPERKKFLEILNGSFAGNWANKMIPYMSDTESDDLTRSFVKIGAVREVDMKKAISFKISVSDSILTGEKIDIKNILDSKNKIKAQYKEDYKKIFRTMIVFAMFYSQPYYKKTKEYTWKLKERKTARGNFKEYEEKLKNDDFVSNIYKKKDIIICNENGTGVFNMFNFVSNLFENGLENTLVKEIEKTLYEAIFLNSNNKKMNHFIADLEIDAEFDEWNKLSYSLVLPIHDLDLCYNLAKRIRQRMYGAKKQTLEVTEILPEYLDILKFIEERLEGNDTYYNITEKEFKLSEIYNQCPYVKWIREYDTYLIADFKIQFEEMLKLVVGCGKPERGEIGKREILPYGD